MCACCSVLAVASEDLPVAAGAYEVLAELARTDIQFVADPAVGPLTAVNRKLALDTAPCAG